VPESRRRGCASVRLRDGFDDGVVEAVALLQQHLERALDVGLHRARGEVQDAHVLNVGALGEVRQRVVRTPEEERGEELLAILVTREGARLAHERPDDVPVVDAMDLVAAQPWHRLDEPPAEMNLDDVGMLAHLDGVTDEPRWDGIDAPAGAHGAPQAHPRDEGRVARHGGRRQRTEVLALELEGLGWPRGRQKFEGPVGADPSGASVGERNLTATPGRTSSRRSRLPGVREGERDRVSVVRVAVHRVPAV
jgi:hypothetical protein